jgi:hypothetical protein
MVVEKEKLREEGIPYLPGELLQKALEREAIREPIL